MLGGGDFARLKPKLSKSSMRSSNPGGGYSVSLILVSSCIADSLSHTMCVETNDWKSIITIREQKSLPIMKHAYTMNIFMHFIRLT